jgi:hypothetical protein
MSWRCPLPAECVPHKQSPPSRRADGVQDQRLCRRTGWHGFARQPKQRGFSLFRRQLAGKRYMRFEGSAVLRVGHRPQPLHEAGVQIVKLARSRGQQHAAAPREWLAEQDLEGRRSGRLGAKRGVDACGLRAGQLPDQREMGRRAVGVGWIMRPPQGSKAGFDRLAEADDEDQGLGKRCRGHGLA